MKVFAVIVCFNPDLAHLRRTCEQLAVDGATIILVDNSEPGVVAESKEFSSCTAISSGRNLGIARAQNIGIDRAREAGAEVIVFFDQDSTINPGFLDALLSPSCSGAPGSLPR